jgi:hypothetical protein
VSRTSRLGLWAYNRKNQQRRKNKRGKADSFSVVFDSWRVNVYGYDRDLMWKAPLAAVNKGLSPKFLATQAKFTLMNIK